MKMASTTQTYAWNVVEQQLVVQQSTEIVSDGDRAIRVFMMNGPRSSYTSARSAAAKITPKHHHLMHHPLCVLC